MTVVYYTLGVLIFFFAIMASIGLHELGHMIPAKRFGGKVTHYFIGFGPTIWSRQRGETEYGVKAIPLGGYVKIVGMLPPAREDHLTSAAASASVQDGSGPEPERVRASNTGLFTQLISDARAAEWETIGPQDSHRLFYKMSWWKKVTVMSGGPMVNLAIAFFLFAGVFATYGNISDIRATTTVSEVSQCVVPYAEDGRECETSDPLTPAKLAGLENGDRIVGFNGTSVDSWEGLQTLIRGNSDGAAEITFVRDGVTMTAQTNTTVQARPNSLEDETLTQVGFLGVSPETYVATGGPLYTLGEMGGMTLDTLKSLYTLPAKVGHVALAIVGLEERDPAGPISVVGGGRIAGETAASEVFPFQEKVVFLAMIIAGFNLFIGLFNFIPLLPLDGGHVAGALYEALRRGFARLAGRPDPGYADVARLLPVAYVVASTLLVMGVILIIGDLVVPVRLPS
jgi:membrane-associated protease RseP (regulator of RpoE activity)